MRFEFDPPLPPASAVVDTFGQTIRLIEGDQLLATARWIAPASSVGSVQLLELHVDPKVRRAGHGRRVMQQLLDQAVKYHTAGKLHLRRIWVGVGHKSQVIGRAFLTGEGFHHVGSAGGLFGDEDMLVYVKAYR
jgi:ribosomal protein S18 acetylase RimI-like enzyme